MLATFLDPKYKNLSIVADEASKVGIKNRILELMKESEMHHREKNPLEMEPASAPDVNMQESEEDDSPSDFLAALEKEVAQGDAVIMAVFLNSSSVDETCENELTRYVASPSLLIRSKEGHNNSLDWWKSNEKHFPILARLARIYLPIQATSAPAERVFSRASRIISNLRTGLTPAMAGRLLFVSSNWDWYQQQVAVQQTLAEMAD